MRSYQNLKIADVLSEGDISGFAHGNDHPFKSIYFNDIPIQNEDGTYNYTGVEVSYRLGTPDQSVCEQFDTVDRTVPVNFHLKDGQVFSRRISNKNIENININLAIQGQDTEEQHVVIELFDGTKLSNTQTVALSGSEDNQYIKTVALDLSSINDETIIKIRLEGSENTKAGIYVQSIVEHIPAYLSYAHTALTYLNIPAEAFDGRTPRRNYLIKGRVINVPSNYDPVTRTYQGFWDGSFKQAYTDNPAWVFYDVLTNKRYSSLAKRIEASDVDKWSLYKIARLCDTMVDDDKGGKEPLFSCNVVIRKQEQVAKVLQQLASVFVGLPIWTGECLEVVSEQEGGVKFEVDETKVVNGVFNYSSVGAKAVHTAVNVRYKDKKHAYKELTEHVSDDWAIARFGLNIKTVDAFACTSRSQALRLAKWVLETEVNQLQSVSFSMSREAMAFKPYDVIRIVDELMGTKEYRVLGITEEGDDGIYSISCIEHYDRKKEKIRSYPLVHQTTQDNAPVFLNLTDFKKDSENVFISWDAGQSTEYHVKLFKNNKFEREMTVKSPDVSFKGLPPAHYRLEVSARAPNGQFCSPVIKEWAVDYTLQSVTATPDVLAIKLEWTNPNLIFKNAGVEIWHATSNNQNEAQLIATQPMPSHSFVLNGIKIHEMHYFWLRVADTDGNKGSFVAASGQCSRDVSLIVDSIQGQVTKSALAQSLIDSIQKDIDAGVLEGTKEQEKKLLEKARELGTKIASVEHLATSQAQKMEDVSASANGWVSALEAEKTARVSGDQAESTARRSLASQVNSNTSSITSLTKTVTNERVSTAEKIESLSSEVKNVKAGGKNLLLNGQFADQSHWDFSASRRVHVNDAYTNDVDVGINLWNKCKATQTLNLPAGEYTLSVKFRSYHKDTDSIKLYINKESKEFTMTGSEYYLCVLTVSSSTPITSVAIEALPGSDVMIAQAKLEKGSKATDWTPAPVDAGRVASAISANLDKLSKTVADNKSAAAKEVSALGAKVDTNKSSIDTLSQTVATTNEATANKITSLTAQVESQPSVAVCFTTVEDFKKDWNIRTGGSNLSMSSYPSLVVGGSGQNGYIWTAMKRRFPMMSRWVYRITYRVDLSQSGGRSYFGVEGFDKDGNLCNNSGSNSWSSQHYAKHGTERTAWHDVVIHLVGDRVTDHSHLPNVKVIRHDVKAIAPLFIFGYSNQNSEVHLASIKVELLTEEELKASSAYTIKTQAIAGGKRAIAGISMGATADEKTAESSIIVMADKFGVVKNANDGTVKPLFTVKDNQTAINGDLIASGTIAGDALIAGSSIRAPNITGGTINGGVIRGARFEGVTGVFEGELSAQSLASAGVNSAYSLKVPFGEDLKIYKAFRVMFLDGTNIVPITCVRVSKKINLHITATETTVFDIYKRTIYGFDKIFNAVLFAGEKTSLNVDFSFEAGKIITVDNVVLPPELRSKEWWDVRFRYSLTYSRPWVKALGLVAGSMEKQHEDTILVVSKIDGESILRSVASSEELKKERFNGNFFSLNEGGEDPKSSFRDIVKAYEFYKKGYGELLIISSKYNKTSVAQKSLKISY